ncbi:hypothetical protein KCV07_g6133, partial [Aureobasidium melanogenum]
MGTVNSMGKSGVGDQARESVFSLDQSKFNTAFFLSSSSQSPIVGAVFMNTGVKYFAMVVFTIGTYAVNSHILGWVGAAFSAGTALVAWIVKIIMKRRNEKLRQSEDEVQIFYVY